MTSKGRLRSTRTQLIRHRANTMRAQYFQVTDLRYKSRVETCAQVGNSIEPGRNGFEDDWPIFRDVRSRLIWLFKWQKRVTRIEAWCDTDHAGFVRTRKSVSGCALMLGNSTVSTYCKGQAVIALSSREAEVLWIGGVQHRRHLAYRVSSWIGSGSSMPTVDGRDSWYRNWKPTRARTSEAHRHRYFFGCNQWLPKTRSRLARSLQKR